MEEVTYFRGCVRELTDSLVDMARILLPRFACTSNFYGGRPRKRVTSYIDSPPELREWSRRNAPADYVFPTEGYRNTSQ